MKRPPSAMQAYADRLAEYLSVGRSQVECAKENQDLQLAAWAEWTYNVTVTTQTKTHGKVYFV